MFPAHFLHKHQKELLSLRSRKRLRRLKCLSLFLCHSYHFFPCIMYILLPYFACILLWNLAAPIKCNHSCIFELSSLCKLRSPGKGGCAKPCPSSRYWNWAIWGSWIWVIVKGRKGNWNCKKWEFLRQILGRSRSCQKKWRGLNISAAQNHQCKDITVLGQFAEILMMVMATWCWWSK